MSTEIRVASVNISREKGTIKEPVECIVLGAEGIEGDAHAGPWHRQISLLSQDRIDAWVASHGRAVAAGEFAENITLAGIDLLAVAPLDRFVFGDVELEVTQIGKACHGDGCAIYREVGECIMPREGLFARVISGGQLRPGDVGHYHPRPMRIEIITLSDRAAAGVYPDRSGPAIEALLQETMPKARWHLELTRSLLSDDAGALRQALEASQADVIITTGGTGIGPRDITPEVVSAHCDKEIPGIMDHIRLTYGATKPGALLSRSVAGVKGQTLLFALPGSVKAVHEYMTEIMKVLEHLIYTVHGIDRHGA